MIEVNVKRVRRRGDATFGALTIVKRIPVGYTIENSSHIVKSGIYVGRKYHSPKFRREVILLDVPGREGIEFHIANFAKDVRGCLGVGKKIGRINGVDAVLGSGKAFLEFMSHLDEDGVVCVIEDI